MVAIKSEVEMAVEKLTRGYEEQAHLYAKMLELSLEQREALRKKVPLDRFMDLLEEKEDILQLTGQIDERMVEAKEALQFVNPEDCPCRERLGALLDHVAMLIEDVRSVEMSNALFLGEWRDCA